MIGALILGLVAGFLARLFVPGEQSMGFIATLILGLVGAIVGWAVFTQLFGIGDDDIFDLGGLLGAVVGAVLVLLAWMQWERRSHRGGPLTN